MTRQVVRRQSHGQALAELGLVLFLLLMMMLGIVEFGRLLMLTNMITHAARDGARVAAVANRQELIAGNVTAIQQHVRDQVLGVVPASTIDSVDVTFQDAAIDTVTVTISGTIPYIFPIASLWGTELNFARSVTFRHESSG